MIDSIGFRQAMRLTAVAVVSLLVAASITIAPSAVSADHIGVEMRIVAQRLADGRTEFALQSLRNDQWGERLFPTQRFFPADAAVDRWLVSTPIAVLSTSTAADSSAVLELIELRIAARRLNSGRIEFALQARQANDQWSQRLLATRRFFPAQATVERWLKSSPLRVKLHEPPKPTPGSAVAQYASPMCIYYPPNAVDLELNIEIWFTGATSYSIEPTMLSGLEPYIGRAHGVAVVGFENDGLMTTMTIPPGGIGPFTLTALGEPGTTPAQIELYLRRSEQDRLFDTCD